MPTMIPYNGHFGKNCFHPLFCFTSDGDGLTAKLRPGNVHSATGTLDLIKPIVVRYRKRLNLFWLRGASAFFDSDIYEFCEEKRVAYFFRLRSNAVLTRLIRPYLNMPVGPPPQSYVQFKYIDMAYQANSLDKSRRVTVKIGWHMGELFPHYYFIVTNSRLSAFSVVKVCNGRAMLKTGSRKVKTRCTVTRQAATGSRRRKYG